MLKTTALAPNDYLPEKDITEFREDGREIVIARKGTPIPMKQAVRLGLVKQEAKKAAAPAENKSAAPVESTKKGGEK